MLEPVPNKIISNKGCRPRNAATRRRNSSHLNYDRQIPFQPPPLSQEATAVKAKSLAVKLEAAVVSVDKLHSNIQKAASTELTTPLKKRSPQTWRSLHKRSPSYEDNRNGESDAAVAPVVDVTPRIKTNILLKLSCKYSCESLRRICDMTTQSL